MDSNTFCVVFDKAVNDLKNVKVTTSGGEITVSDVYLQVPGNYGSRYVDIEGTIISGVTYTITATDVNDLQASKDFVWGDNTTYTISYNPNGGTGTIPVTTYTEGDTNVKVNDGSGLTPPSSKVFKEWKTKADGTGGAIPTSTIVNSSLISSLGLNSTNTTTTLYAVYEDEPTGTQLTATITYASPTLTYAGSSSEFAAPTVTLTDGEGQTVANATVVECIAWTVSDQTSITAIGNDGAIANNAIAKATGSNITITATFTPKTGYVIDKATATIKINKGTQTVTHSASPSILTNGSADSAATALNVTVTTGNTASDQISYSWCSTENGTYGEDFPALVAESPIYAKFVVAGNALWIEYTSEPISIAVAAPE